MSASILVLVVIVTFELILIWFLKRELNNFRANYSQAVLKICDMFIEVASRIEEIDKRLKIVEDRNKI